MTKKNSNKQKNITKQKTNLKTVWMSQAQLVGMILPGIIIIFIFSYIPMYGALMAFQNYNPIKGVWGSEWVGLKHFAKFFRSPMTLRVLKNTLVLGVYNFLWSFPAPIILALLMDQLPFLKFKKLVQTVSYFPHFISTVVIVGLLKEIFSSDGIVNFVRNGLGLSSFAFMSSAGAFRSLFIGSGIWQSIGWGSIIYLAALSNVDPQLNEAAIMDGANRWQQVKYISWPAIIPTTTILIIFSISGILGSDSQKVLLMYSPATYQTADIIGTYVYREGILGGSYEYTTAIGLMMNVVSCIMLAMANQISKKLGETSLW